MSRERGFENTDRYADERLRILRQAAAGVLALTVTASGCNTSEAGSPQLVTEGVRYDRAVEQAIDTCIDADNQPFSSAEIEQDYVLSTALERELEEQAISLSDTELQRKALAASEEQFRIKHPIYGPDTEFNICLTDIEGQQVAVAVPHDSLSHDSLK